MELKNMVTLHVETMNERKVLFNVIADTIAYDTLANSISFSFYEYNSKQDKMEIINYIHKLYIGDIFYLKQQNEYM